jgi:LacI family transcriptional regulator
VAVTLKQVAERCGVSRLTVSDILNDKPKPYAAATRERVKAAAAELGYVPNGAARAIARRRHARVGLLEHTFNNVSFLPQQLVEGLLAGCEAAELELSLSRSSEEDFVDPVFVPRILREWCVDGLLVNINYAVTPALDELCRAHALPALWLNCKRADNCVYGDDEGAARTLTEHLLARGYRDIRYYGMAAKGQVHYSKLDRAGGYAAAMRQAGLEPLVYLAGRDRYDLRPELVASAGGSAPPVWIGYSGMELSALMAALITTGVRVAEDLLLATFAVGSEYAPLCVAQMRQPLDAIGRHAVADLVRLIEHPRGAQPPRAVPWKLRAGAVA